MLKRRSGLRADAVSLLETKITMLKLNASTSRARPSRAAALLSVCCFLAAVILSAAGCSSGTIAADSAPGAAPVAQPPAPVATIPPQDQARINLQNAAMQQAHQAQVQQSYMAARSMVEHEKNANK